MKYDKLKIWFEFKREFTNRRYSEALISKLKGMVEMFLEGESLSVITIGYTMSEIQEVTNWLEANGYLPEKYYTPLNID